MRTLGSVLAASVLAVGCTGQGAQRESLPPETTKSEAEAEVAFAFTVADAPGRECIGLIVEAEDDRADAENFALDFISAAAADDVEGAEEAYGGLLGSVVGYEAALDEAETSCPDEMAEMVLQARENLALDKALKNLRELCRERFTRLGWDC